MSRVSVEIVWRRKRSLALLQNSFLQIEQYASGLKMRPASSADNGLAVWLLFDTFNMLVFSNRLASCCWCTLASSLSSWPDSLARVARAGEAVKLAKLIV